LNALHIHIHNTRHMNTIVHTNKSMINEYAYFGHAHAFVPFLIYGSSTRTSTCGPKSYFHIKYDKNVPVIQIPGTTKHKTLKHKNTNPVRTTSKVHAKFLLSPQTVQSTKYRQYQPPTNLFY